MTSNTTLALLIAGALGSACATPQKHLPSAQFVDPDFKKTTAEVERDFYAAYHTLLTQPQPARADQERALDALASHTHELINYTTRTPCSETKTLYTNLKPVFTDAITYGIKLYGEAFFDKPVCTTIMSNYRVLDALIDKCGAENEPKKLLPPKTVPSQSNIILL